MVVELVLLLFLVALCGGYLATWLEQHDILAPEPIRIRAERKRHHR